MSRDSTLRIMTRITAEKALSATRTHVAEVASVPEDDITTDLTFADLGIDSVRVMAVIAGLENEFGVELKSREGAMSWSVGELAQRVADATDV